MRRTAYARCSMTRLRSLFVRMYPASIRAGSLGALAVLLTFAGAPSAARAQTPGTLDASFDPAIAKVTAFAVAVDSQQRVIVGGDELTFSRFNPDGTEDGDFNPPGFGGDSRIIFGLTVDEQDRIIAVGKFKSSGSNPINIKRFNAADGSNDGSFNPGKGANDTIVAVRLQAIDANPDNDKIIVGGLFTRFNGQRRDRLARLNQDGSLDASFNSGLSFNDEVYAIALQKSAVDGLENGQILVGGSFDGVNGSGVGNLARVDVDGAFDSSFRPDINGHVFAIVAQPDGKIVIGGDFEAVNGVEARGLARLNADGSLDDTFHAGVRENDNQSVPPTAVYALLLQDNGRIVVGGNFLKLNDVTRRFVGRLEADGSLDESFDSGDRIVNRAEALALDPVSHNIAVAEIVSKKMEGNDNYPNVLKRLFGDPLVSIVTAQDALELGQGGLFEVTRRGGNQNLPLTVFYENRVGGKKRATSGVDYFALPGFVTIPAGKSSAQIAVAPIDDDAVEPSERVTLVLRPDADYDVFAEEAKATVRIIDND
jgi:uncharacterized delta-60 repeat protein